MYFGTSRPSQITRIICRFAVTVTVLLVISALYGEKLIEALLPLLQSELRWLDDNYRILKLGLAAQDGDSVIRLDVTLARFVVVGKHVIAPDPRGHAAVTTLTSSVFRPVILGLAFLAAWPAQLVMQYAWRFAIGLLLALLIILTDVPLVLLGEVWELLITVNDPHSFSLLIAWKDFLQGGGRLALALCAAMIAIGLTHKFSPSRTV